ncbi:MAG: hypothetical protein LBQ33_07060 [Oscillospiraceae bacterium]|nr:hypothetical protein [Oscillospiraceae bacterium]
MEAFITTITDFFADFDLDSITGLFADFDLAAIWQSIVDFFTGLFA